MIDLKHLGELEAAAHPAPWTWKSRKGLFDRSGAELIGPLTWSNPKAEIGGYVSAIELIIALRNNARALIRELEAARQVVEEARGENENALDRAIAAYDALLVAEGGEEKP